MIADFELILANETPEFSDKMKAGENYTLFHTLKNAGVFAFGSLHNFHVAHSASRNYTWKTGILCVCNIDGVGQYIEKSGE